MFRVWNPRFKSWSVFSQDHLARVLLDWGPDAAGHDAVLDAVKSVRLFNLYSQLQAAPQEWQAAQVRPRAWRRLLLTMHERRQAHLHAAWLRFARRGMYMPHAMLVTFFTKHICKALTALATCLAILVTCCCSCTGSAAGG